MTTTIHEISWSRGARWFLAISLLLYLGFVGVALGQARFPVLAAVVMEAGTCALLLWLFRLIQTLRVAIDGMDLVVGFGLWKRRIPFHSIDRVSPVRYHWVRWGGWGIRWRPGAVLYNVPGDQGRAVELTLRDGKRVLFSARNPDAVASAIREQRAAMPC